MISPVARIENRIETTIERDGTDIAS
jgi:hypothetical protein